MLDVEITVDESDGQGRRLDVEDLDPAESQALYGAEAGVEILVGSSELQCGLEALGWAGQDLRHGRFAQARDEDQMQTS